MAAKGKRLTTTDGKVVIVNKNANGDGSVYESGGRWYATYYDRDGKRRRVSAASRPLVREKLDAKLAEIAAADAAPSGPLGDEPTLAALVDYWLDHGMDVRPNTEVSYRNQCAKIVAQLGDVRLEDLDEDVIATAINSWRSEGMADHTIVNIRARLNQIAAWGVRKKLLTHNPVPARKDLKTAKPKRKRFQRTLTLDEAKRLLANCAAHPMGAAVALLFTNGIRGAEALGLAWQDVDLDAGTMTIRRSSTFAGKGIGQVIGEPKTERTRGTLQLSPLCVDLLRQRKAQQDAERALAGDLWQRVTYDGERIDLIFTTALGGPKYTQNLYEAVQAVAGFAGLDPHGIGTHAGRRTVVTVLYAQGLDVAQIARYVGHSETKTTEGYIRDQRRRDAATDSLVADVFDVG